MSGRFQDVWEFVWPEIWLQFEQSGIWVEVLDESGYTTDDLYVDLYVEFVKALKKAPKPSDYSAVANDPVRDRQVLKTTPATSLRCEAATSRFFESAYEVISESGSIELEKEFTTLVRSFLNFRNLRYEVVEPFKLHSHLPGVFTALFSDLLEATT